MPSLEHASASSVSGADGGSTNAVIVTGRRNWSKKRKKKNKEKVDNNTSKDVATIPRNNSSSSNIVQSSAVPELRQWLLSQPHLRGVRADDSFLLRFLRFQKFRSHDAQAVLDKYVHMRTAHPEWFRGLDIRNPTLRGLMTSGYLLVLPGRDPRTGRRVVFSRASAMDTSRYSACDVMRAHILAYEALLCDDDVQEQGLTYVFDERDINWRHIAIWSPGEISKAFSCCERALPLRHQEIHFVHLPWTMNLVFQFAKSLLSQKLRERFQTHSSFEKLAEEEEEGGEGDKEKGFPCHMLPEGYFGGGSVSLEEMIRLWVEELEEKRDLVLGLDQMWHGLAAPDQRTSAAAAVGGSEEAEEEGGVLEVVGSVRKMENGNKAGAATATSGNK